MALAFSHTHTKTDPLETGGVGSRGHAAPGVKRDHFATSEHGVAAIGMTRQDSNGCDDYRGELGGNKTECRARARKIENGLPEWDIS